MTEERKSGSGLGITHAQIVRQEKLEAAKNMRRAPTPAEHAFWEHVRGRRYPGYRVRRQQVIHGFIADFYCDALRLVIEIDGEIHAKTREADLERDAILSGKGLRILRVTNEDVLERMAWVMERVFGVTPPPAPPQKGRGENQ